MKWFGRGRSCVAGEEEMDYDTDSDCISVADSQSHRGDLHTLQEINDFLDETYGKSVSDYFPDVEKFIKSVATLQKVLGVDVLDEKRHFRLKKHVTSLRKMLQINKGKQSKRLILSKL